MRVSSQYEHQLQAAYWEISTRGIRVDTDKIEEAIRICDSEISRNLRVCTNQWGRTVFVGADNAPEDEEEDACNLNATQGDYALLKTLRDLGYEVPKITKKNEEGEYEQSYSAGELAIQKMLSTNQFNYPGGDPALRAVLTIRELGALKNRYLTARLLRRGEDSFFLSIYNVAGTTTGRRSSKKHPMGFGNNGQNFPSHSTTAGLFRNCLIARRGGVLLFVDQVQAEDWPVQALACNLKGLAELRSGVDRHSKLASLIFNHRVPSKNDPDWDDAQYESERYIGKKARHANNYGMTPPRLQDVLVQEKSLSVSMAICKQILDTAHLENPYVKDVFHKYIKDTLNATRVLITPSPFLRERQFISLRPTDGNSAGIKEAYAFIPQSTVGDNTGFALLDIESDSESKGFVVQEGHDSLVLDVEDSYPKVYSTLLRVDKAFDRKIRFANGIEFQIPLEAKIGYSFGEAVKIKSFTPEGVKAAMQKLQDLAKKSSTFQIAVGA